MLDEITGGLTQALCDWTHLETWARYATATGLGYVLTRGAWWLAKDAARLAAATCRGTLAAWDRYRVWRHTPSKAARIAAQDAQIASMQVQLNDLLVAVTAPAAKHYPPGMPAHQRPA